MRVLPFINAVVEPQNNKNNMLSESVGALWKPKEKTASGPVLTGQIEVDGKKIAVAVFPNKFKKEAKHPDYRIVKSEKSSSFAKDFVEEDL